MTRLEYDDEDRKIRSALQDGIKDYQKKLNRKKAENLIEHKMKLKD